VNSLSKNNKKLIISIGQDEFEGPDPKMYVTKVIDIEEGVRKKLMANELKLELQKQIDAKNKETQKYSPNKLKEKQRLLNKMEELNKRAILSKEQRVNDQPIQKDTHNIFDTRLKQIENELIQKEKAFNMELEKLRYRDDNIQKTINYNLLSLKNHIIGKSNATTSESCGLGNYGKLYFNDYKNINQFSFQTNKDRIPQRVKTEKFAKEDLLDNESELIPYIESPISKPKSRSHVQYNNKRRLHNKSACEQLDELMKEFLSNERGHNKSFGTFNQF